MLSLFSATTAFSGSELISKFNDWKVVHKKSYGTSDAEATALAAFASNEQIIMDHNFGKNSTYKLGHNEFSDMTWDEFSRTVMSELYLNKQPKNKMRVHLKGKNGNAIDDSVDWVAKGAVTPVKNQQRCGSCWAFSTVGAVEGALAVETGKLISLSEEELVQCDHNGDQGCQGGLMDNAFEWMESGNKLTTETAYPYTSGSGTTGTCDSAKEAAGTVSITSHKDVPAGDEDALKSAVAAAGRDRHRGGQVGLPAVQVGRLRLGLVRHQARPRRAARRLRHRLRLGQGLLEGEELVGHDLW